MKTIDVIKKAILSEKAYKLMEAGIYSFIVDSRSTRDEIKKTVSSQFGVKVKKVNLANFSSKTKRVATTRKMTAVGGGRKAIVFLQKGESIGVLSPKTETKKESKKEKPKEDKKSKG